MSRVVKRVGKIVAPLAKPLIKGVKKLMKNKVVRFIAIAAAAYFTAGAALGAIGTIGTSTSMLSGAMSGLGSAWGGLTGAGSALMSGNFAGVASSLGSGLSSATAAGAQGMGFSAAASAVSSGTPILSTAAPGALSETAGAAMHSGTGDVVGTVAGQAGQTTSALQAPASAAVHSGTGDVVGTVAGQAGSQGAGRGIVGRALDFMGTQGGGLAVSTGLKLAGGMIADSSAARQRQQDIDRMNANQNVSGINVNLGSQGGGGSFMPSGPVDVPSFDPATIIGGGQAPTVAGQKAPLMQPRQNQQQQQPTGLFGARFAF